MSNASLIVASDAPKSWLNASETRYKRFKDPRNISSARFPVKLDIATYKCYWNFFKFWKSDHRQPSYGQICNPLVIKTWTEKNLTTPFRSVWNANKTNGLIFYSTYWEPIKVPRLLIQPDPTIIKPFMHTLSFQWPLFLIRYKFGARICYFFPPTHTVLSTQLCFYTGSYQIFLRKI